MSNCPTCGRPLPESDLASPGLDLTPAPATPAPIPAPTVTPVTPVTPLSPPALTSSSTPVTPTAPDPATTTAAVKPGYKTTEFWLSAVATLLGMFMVSGVVGDESTAMRIAGAIAAALTALGYQVIRTSKKGTPKP